MTWQNSAIAITTFLPLLGALVILAMPKDNERAIRGMGIVVTGVAMLFAIAILVTFNYSASGLQFVLDVPWISVINAHFHVGIDGISLPLYALTFILSFLCAIYTWRYVPDPGKAKVFLALVLLLETGMAGTFIAFDLILFFVFWELVLVPMYFLIAKWGSDNREYASIKFFLYTLFGSVFMLLAFIGLYFASPDHTWNVLDLTAAGAGGAFGRTFQLIAFGGIALGFAIKVPMWPFHTWLPDAHTEAPTVGSVLLAGVLLKMGTYGFIRIAIPILPEAAKAFAPVIGLFAVIGTAYRSLGCLAQRDLKRLIAFSSVGHMGFVMLGIATLTPLGFNAAVFGMVAHGLITGMLFFVVGSTYDRYHTRQISEIGGGMSQVMPYMAGVFALVAIASLGLPGLAGFWGEFTSLLAAFNPAPGLSVGLFRGFMVAGAVGTVLTAGYFLWTLQRVNQGVLPDRWKEKKFSDILGVEWLAWTPLLVSIVVFGLFPKLIFGMTEGPIDLLLGVGH